MTTPSTPDSLPPFAESYPLEPSPLAKMQGACPEEKIRMTLDAYLAKRLAEATSRGRP